MASDLKGVSILFFCPKFFNYEIEIIQNLEAMGATVAGFDDRPSNTVITKTLIRLDKRFLKRQITKYYKTIMLDLVKAKRHFDYVLFLNPESITEDILAGYKKQFAAAKFILYMWDSFKNRKSSDSLLPFFDSKFTFDPDDAKRYNLILRPLFYTTIYKAQNRKEIFDLLFVGTAHSDRYNFIQKLKSKTESLINIKTCFYINSKLLFWGKKIMAKDFRKVPYSDISFNSLSHRENADLVHQSKAIIDINHPKQIGLTMRTFETLGAQKNLSQQMPMF